MYVLYLSPNVNFYCNNLPYPHIYSYITVNKLYVIVKLFYFKESSKPTVLPQETLTVSGSWSQLVGENVYLRFNESNK